MGDLKNKKFDFKDVRGKRVIIASHCILNQNSRIATCAFSEAQTPGVVEFCLENKIGIIQGPCPETELLGLTRSGMDINALDGSYIAEDGEIYDQLKSPRLAPRLQAMAQNLIAQAKQYLDQGFDVLGILGIAGSPACGVSLTYYKTMTEGQGAFVEQLKAEMVKANIDIPIIEIAETPGSDRVNLDAVQALLG